MKKEKKSAGTRKTGTLSLPSKFYETFMNNIKSLKSEISEDKRVIHYWVVDQGVDVTRYDGSVYQHKLVRQLIDRTKTNKDKLEILENIIKCSKEKKKDS